MKSVVIAGYARSPFHFAKKGALARIRPDELCAAVIAGLVERSGIDPRDIEDVLVGCAIPEGEQGLNVARLTSFLAHLPITVAGATVNRFCGSSMQTIHMAAGAIQLDAGEAFICAGVEIDEPRADDGLQPDAPSRSREGISASLHVDGPDRRECRAQVPGDARAAAGSRGRQPPQGSGGAAGGQAQGRDRADQDARRPGRCRWLHPRRDQPGGARVAGAGLRCIGHGDGRHLLAADRRGVRRAGLHRGLCDAQQAHDFGAAEERRGRRLCAGDHGHRAQSRRRRRR